MRTTSGDEPDCPRRLQPDTAGGHRKGADGSGLRSQTPPSSSTLPGRCKPPTPRPCVGTEMGTRTCNNPATRPNRRKRATRHKSIESRAQQRKPEDRPSDIKRLRLHRARTWEARAGGARTDPHEIRAGLTCNFCCPLAGFCLYPDELIRSPSSQTYGDVPPGISDASLCPLDRETPFIGNEAWFAMQVPQITVATREGAFLKCFGESSLLELKWFLVSGVSYSRYHPV